MLTRPTAQSLFPQPLLASPSQIETFASCPFRHFLRYGLALQPREENDLPIMDLEGVYHHILENIVRDMLRRRADWASLSPEQASLWVRTYAAKVSQSLRGEMMLSNARNRYLLTRIEKTLEQVLASQQAIAQRGQFHTAFGKLPFGSDDAAIPPLIVQTPNGHQVHLHGQIDRVDILENQAAFTILDYRLYGGDIRLSHVYHGLSLQLLTYLLVLQANSQTLAGRPMTPAAAFYVRLLRQLERYDHPSEAPDPSDPGFVIDKQRGHMAPLLLNADKTGGI
jgi:ATP-dependent helicase/nuclease subunit B